MQSVKSLIVEDEIIMQKILYNTLKHLGTCHVAKDGIEGLEKVKQSITENEYYDLICSDIRMPRMDGTKLLEMVRTLESKKVTDKKSVFIIITGMNDIDILKKCSSLGVSSFLLKPFNKFNLLKALKGHKVVPKDYSFPMNS